MEVWICPARKQDTDNSLVFVLCREMKRCPAIVILSVSNGTSTKQFFNSFKVIRNRCIMKGSAAIYINARPR